MIKRVRLILTLAFTLLSGQASADVCLYPGTFDPFHRSHFEEVMALLSQKGCEQVYILPIHEAYYKSTVVGKQPQFLSGELRETFIENIFAGETRVHVVNDLKTISHQVFRTLENTMQKYGSLHQASARLAVGTDVLATWQNLVGFGDFLDQNKLIVSTDPKTPELNEKLKKAFSNSDRIEFVDATQDGIRSFQSMQVLLKDINHTHPNEAVLRNYFTDPGAKFLADHWSDFQSELKRLTKDNSTYQASLIEKVLLPALEENRLDAHVLVWLQSDLRTRAILAKLTDDPASWSKVSHELVAIAPRKLKFGSGGFLVTDLSRALDHPQTQRAVRLIGKTTAFESFLPETKAVETSRVERFAERTLSQVKAKIYNALSPKFKRIARTQDSATYRFRDLSADEKERLLGAGSDEEITLYRGVKPKANMQNLLKQWKEEGFISQTALQHKLAGESLDVALQASEKQFQEMGIRNSVVNHIVGDWHDTPLISATLDKALATAVAGKGGYVFTIKVKRSEGFLVNDPVYWQKTPWKNAGNPFANNEEFAVRHQIKPSSIVLAEEVLEDSSLKAILGNYESALIKGVPYYLKNTCTRYLEKLF